MEATISLAPEPGYAGPKRSLVIAGGGMRVAYQAGVIRALEEAGLRFQHADGTSGGTINLAMLLSGITPSDMCERWRTLKVRDFVSFVPLHQYLKAYDMMAMGDADGIVENVFPHLGIDVDRVKKAQGLTGTFNVCNYTQKTNVAVPHGEISLDLLVAGISLPVFMPPVEIGNEIYTDSVWIKDANLMEAVRRGAEEIWLIWCIGNSPTYKRGLFNQYVHMIELSANGALFEEFDRIKEINERITRGDSPYGQARPIRLHVIKPEYPLPLDPDLYLGHITTGTLISMGYADAKQYLSTRSENGVPFVPLATRMKDPGLGITFNETLAGAFALGETNPEDGSKAGEQKRTNLTLHASVHIQDVGSFISDPAPLGRVTGSIDFAPMGGTVLASSGLIKLLSASEESALKSVVYELRFEHEGESYFLTGRKELRDDPGFDVWKDATTLVTRLHKGTDAKSPILGAGILKLGLMDLARLVSSFHVTNADSIGEELEVRAEFGRFFLGKLWDGYANIPGAE